MSKIDIYLNTTMRHLMTKILVMSDKDNYLDSGYCLDAPDCIPNGSVKKQFDTILPEPYPYVDCSLRPRY